MEIIQKQANEIESLIDKFIIQYINDNQYNKLRIFSNEEIKILQILLKDELNYAIFEDELAEMVHIEVAKLYYKAFEKKFSSDNPNLGLDFNIWIKAYVKTFESNHDFIDFLSVKLDELQIEYPKNIDIQDIEDFYTLIKRTDFEFYSELLNSAQYLDDINIMQNPFDELEYEDLKIIYYLSQQKIEGWKCVYLLISLQKEVEEARLKLLAENHKRNLAVGGKIRKNRIEINNIDTMDGINFEKFLVHLFANMNYKADITQVSNDQGADLIIEKLGERTAVQAKCYSSTVGNTAVQEVTGAKQYYNCTKAMVITNNYFTKSAIELAYVNNVELKDREDLISLLANYPVYAEDIFSTEI